MKTYEQWYDEQLMKGFLPTGEGARRAWNDACKMYEDRIINIKRIVMIDKEMLFVLEGRGRKEKFLKDTEEGCKAEILRDLKKEWYLTHQKEKGEIGWPCVELCVELQIIKPIITKEK